MSDLLKKCAKAIKKYNKQINDYKEIGKIPSMPYRAYVNYANHMFVEGNNQLAEEYLKNAISMFPENGNAYIQLGVLKQTEFDFEEAEKCFRSALELEPENVKLLCLLATALTVLNKFDEAYELYEKALKINNRIPDIYVCKSSTLMKQERYREARTLLMDAIEKEQLLPDVKYFILLASLEIELAMYDEALERYNFILKNRSAFDYLYHNVAYIYFRQRNYKEAIDALLKAIAAEPTKFESYLLLADIHVELEQYEEALSTFNVAMVYGSRFPCLYMSWGNAFIRMKNYKDALEKYLYAMELNEEKVSDELYSKIAECYYMTEDYENAELYVAKTINISPDNPLVNKIRAQLYMREQNYEQAIDILKKTSEASSQKPESFKLLARCYRAIGQNSSVDEFYLKSIDYDSKNLATQLEYAEYLVEVQNWAEAEKKLHILEKNIDENNECDVLVLSFIANYNLAKQNAYSYNFKKAIVIAEKIKSKYPERFIFENEYNDLRGQSE